MRDGCDAARCSFCAVATQGKSSYFREEDCVFVGSSSKRLEGEGGKEEDDEGQRFEEHGWIFFAARLEERLFELRLLILGYAKLQRACGLRHGAMC